MNMCSNHPAVFGLNENETVQIMFMATYFCVLYEVSMMKLKSKRNGMEWSETEQNGAKRKWEQNGNRNRIWFCSWLNSKRSLNDSLKWFLFWAFQFVIQLPHMFFASKVHSKLKRFKLYFRSCFRAIKKAPTSDC